MLALRHSGDRVLFSVRVTPRASVDAVSGERGGALLVRVTAPPAEGRANDAVIRVVARALRLAPSNVVLVRGSAARTKLLSAPRTAEAALLQLGSVQG